MKIACGYVSEWEYDAVRTACVYDEETGELEVEDSGLEPEELEDLGAHLKDYIELPDGTVKEVDPDDPFRVL